MISTINDFLKERRIYEIVLGSINTVIIAFIITGAIYIPNVIAIIIILFDIYWLYKLISWAVNSVSIYFKLTRNVNVNWYERIKEGKFEYQKIHHLVMVTAYKESEELLRDTIKNIANQDFPKEQITFVLAIESRDTEGQQIADNLKKEFQAAFKDFWITSHTLAEDETIGKHSNERYSAIECVRKFRELNMNLKDILITVTDADVVIPQNFLSNITYKFLTEEDSEYSFYHGANLYYSNFVKIPFVERIFASQMSLWYLAILDNKYLGPVSTYTLCLNTLDDVGYWYPDVIMEDANIFYKAIFKYKTKVKSVPIYLPLYMTLPQTEKYFSTLTSFYVTLRRYCFWNIFLNTMILANILKDSKINPVKKFLLLADKLEVDLLWPVYWFLLTFGVLIFVFLNKEFINSPIGSIFHTFATLMAIVYALLFAVIILTDYKLRSKTSFGKFNLLKEILYLPQWIFMPFVGFYTAFLPFIDSQVRLIMDKPLEYVVSAKGTKISKDN